MKSWLRKIMRSFAPPPITEGEIATMRARSEEGAAQALARDEEVRDVASRLLRQRQQNHFGPLIWAALRGESDV